MKEHLFLLQILLQDNTQGMSPGEVLFYSSLTIVIAFVFYRISRYAPARDYYFNRMKWRTPVARNEFLVIQEILTSKFSYYNCLSQNGKAKFINRLHDFVSTKHFVGKEGQEITNEIKILIAASATQLSFGLDNFIFSLFHTIFVYPHEFYSKLLRTELKGATYGNGVIALSWSDFKKGYEIPDDRINLGLHEMAHALKLDVFLGDDFDNRFAENITELIEVSTDEFSKIRDGQQSFLRAYGGRNENEFFAVCVEHFFELPAQFKQKLPGIFDHLCVLLNQNPINKTSDYSYKSESSW